MSNLPESPTWENGVYQLETTDPVEGGPDGIDNQQAKQLANRTAYLKQQIESKTAQATESTAGTAKVATSAEAVAGTDDSKIITPLKLKASIDAVINGAPGALDTLNELAAALGDDANFATTMMNSLAAKADLSWIKSLGTGDQNTTYLSDLNVLLVGGQYAFNLGAVGAPFNFGTLDVSVRGGGEQIQHAKEHNGLRSATRRRLGDGTFTAWDYAIDLSDFAGSFGVSGYQPLPSGFIKQWGYLSLAVGSPNVTINLPVPFPNAMIGATLTINSTDMPAGERNPRYWGMSINGFTANYGNANAVDGYWEAIGY